LDLKEIKELIGMMRKNDLSVFKLEQEGFKITLKRGVDFQPVVTTNGLSGQSVVPLQPSPAPASASSASTAPREILREIKSPMPGTFYSAPSTESPAYAQVGGEVSEDSVVCIIEAMKVMNEINAGMRGTIVEIVAQNGKPVEYDQVLFRVR
jgi:acetyl-CoA carboxylase biotin carboxyl carrier protein